MTFKDKPTFENVIFGQFNPRRLELTYIFERGLVFKCHIIIQFQALRSGACNTGCNMQHPTSATAAARSWVAAPSSPRTDSTFSARSTLRSPSQGLTLVHFSAQCKQILWDTLGACFPPSLLDWGTRGGVTKTA